jgi:hypothetical protein
VTYRLTVCLLAVFTLVGCATASPVLIGRLNPDVTQATIGATICKAGWAKSVRPPASYTSKLKRQQLPAGASAKDYQLDHLMPLELGGAPKDPANLHIVPIHRAEADDVWENRLHKSVCNGSMTLAVAQVKMSEIKRR